MRVDLLQSGVNALAAQQADGVNKLTFHAFSLAEKNDYTFTATMDVSAGATKPRGVEIASFLFSDASRPIRYRALSDTKAVVELRVPEIVPRGPIGNVLVSVKLGATVYPFVIARPYEPGEVMGSRLLDVPTQVDMPLNQKLSTVDSNLGVFYTMHLMLIVPGLTSRFDMTDNETGDEYEPLPTQFLTVAGHKNLPWAFDDLHDQAVISEHANSNRLVPVFNVCNLWYGIPAMMKLDDANFEGAILSGGEAGDGYLYESE